MGLTTNLNWWVYRISGCHQPYGIDTIFWLAGFDLANGDHGARELRESKNAEGISPWCANSCAVFKKSNPQWKVVDLDSIYFSPLFWGKFPPNFDSYFSKRLVQPPTSNHLAKLTDWPMRCLHVTEGNGGFLKWWVSPTTMGFPY